MESDQRELLRAMLHTVPCGAIRIATDGSIEDANDEARRILGLGHDEPGASRPNVELPLASEADGTRTIAVRQPGGRVTRVAARALPIRDARGSLDGALVFLDDTDRKRTEESLRASEQRWRSLAENIPDVVAVLDREARLVSINHTLPSGQSIVGRSAYAFLTEESAQEYRAKFEEVLASRKTARFESRSLAEDGSAAGWFETILVPLAKAEGEPVERVLAVARDVTDRRRNEEAIRASEQRWRTLVDSLPDIVLVLDRDRRILSANFPGADIADLPIIGVLADAFVDETMVDEFRGHVARALETESAVRYEIRSLEAPGVSRWYDAILAPVKTGGVIDRLIVVTRDITTQRAMLASLAEKERLASVGMVAASVAHEIMNPLTYVLANLEVALSPTPEDGPCRRQALIEAREGAKRMQQIVSDLRSLGRAGAEERLYVDARSVLETAIRLSGPEVARTATMRLELLEVPGVLASESRLCQVFINLLVNAAQSMADKPAEEREITVRTRYDEATSLVAIEIEDRGPGIPDILRKRIFEPFFTTKPAGTGLGLSISRDIVGRMGGRIDLESTAGEGTTFTVWLPTTRGESVAPRAG